MKQVFVTTSWDDGHILDKRLVELLKKYKIAGTFYIAPQNREFAPEVLLADKEIKKLSKDFEIGSHTMTHPVLTDITLKDCLDELKKSKDYLENLINKKVTSFCYPRGAFDQHIAQVTRKIGYNYARTVEEYKQDSAGDIFAAGTSIETHRLPLPKLFSAAWRVARFSHWHPFRTLKNLSWERRAKAMFDQVCRDGGVFHLWGHSWAIDNERSWDKVERVFAYIHGRSEISYVTNAELADRWQV